MWTKHKGNLPFNAFVSAASPVLGRESLNKSP